MRSLTLIASLTLAGADTLQSAPKYTLTDLGTLGGVYSIGRSINSAGQVAGLSTVYPNDNNPIRAFFWNGSSMKDLGALGAVEKTSASYGYGINDSGHVTGTATPQQPGDSTHAFVWNGTSMQGLGTLGGSFSIGSDINNAGHVTGSSQTSSLTSNAFLWNGTAMQDLGSLGGSWSYGQSINDPGSIVGASQLIGDTAWRAFLWNGASMQDLGTLGGTHSGAQAINNAGQITGWSWLPDGRIHATMWDGGSIQDLGALDGISSTGYDINNLGQVVGFSTNSGTPRAYLWEKGLMIDLNYLTLNLEGMILTQALGINDAGQITGSGNINGETHAFLLNPVPAAPVPEPGGFGLMGVGLAAALLARKKLSA